MRESEQQTLDEDSSQNPWTEVLGFTDLATKEREETIEEVKRLIEDLGSDHPELFDEEPISAQDYQRELRDAVFSLGGKYRQSHGADNEDIVREIFLEPAQEAGKLTFVDQRGSERIDFKGKLSETGESFAMDVKGGEGQSIGHLLVPSDTELLILWSERNARNTKSPPSRLNEVINRAVRWGFNNSEEPGLMVIRDEPAGAVTDDGKVIPDIVVFPREYPTPENPHPAMPRLEELPAVELLFETLTGTGDLQNEELNKHIWWHELHYSSSSGSGQIEKNIYNCYHESIRLGTRSIDYERISNVE